jgi:hypothetical protein
VTCLSGTADCDANVVIGTNGFCPGRQGGDTGCAGDGAAQKSAACGLL